MTVALARAHLSRLGVVNDPLAEGFLSRPFKITHAMLRRPPLTRFTRTPTLSFLAARTLYFDDAVIDGVANGASQVVIVGAGYDSRAWRLASPGVTFFEVDHPATQADKRSRAPSAAPVFVSADLRTDCLADLLPHSGYDPSRQAVFVVEGLTMYLDEPTVTRLFGDLASIAPIGSRLAANFTVSGGGSVAPVSRAAAKMIRTLWRTRGEPIVNWVRPRELPAHFGKTGWHMDELMAAPELAANYLRTTPMPTTELSPGALITAATRVK